MGIRAVGEHLSAFSAQPSAFKSRSLVGGSVRAANLVPIDISPLIPQGARGAFISHYFPKWLSVAARPRRSAEGFRPSEPKRPCFSHPHPAGGSASGRVRMRLVLAACSGQAEPARIASGEAAHRPPTQISCFGHECS